jgi:diphthine synthase
MLYIIGLGLNNKSLSLEAAEALKQCEQVYLENYTVEFPYEIEELEKIIGKNIEKLERQEVESPKQLFEQAKKQDIALFVYGSPLFATTHISLIEEGKKNKVKTKVLYNASAFDAIAETGLQLYKFGKIASMPEFEGESFIDIVKENQSINAHSLILIDIGLKFEDALEKLEKGLNNKGLEIKKIVVCSKLGTDDSKTYYNTIEELKDKKVQAPFCIILPGKLHFIEEEVLNSFS